MTEAIKNLLDTDGENRAVRGFLLGYTPGATVGEQRDNLREYGFPYWPRWVEDAPAGKTLNKAEAQAWLRHLFALETPAPVEKPKWNGVINPADFLVQTYKAPGAFSGFINLPDYGVRITHKPTGVQVERHEHRNANRNKADAWVEIQKQLDALTNGTSFVPHPGGCAACRDRNDGFWGSYAADCPIHDSSGNLREPT